ncbi:MAG: hypothetical protein ACKOC8_04735 [Pirellulales bacterium]
MTQATRRTILAMLLAGCAVAGDAVAESPAADLPSFLAIKEIDLANRGVFAPGAEWSDEMERVLVKVLTRLPAPATLAAAWAADAVAVSPRGEPTPLGDRLVRVAGRAIFVAPRELPATIAATSGRERYDLVRIVAAEGAVVDVAVARAPRAWPRWRAIDEPAAAVGLPLAAGTGPTPVASAGDAARWPATAPDLLLAATRITWQPPTALGRLGMDYALFDTVVEDRRLEPGDTEAFWAMMAAAARTTPAEIARAAGGPTDILALIDPAQQWFETHRGDPVVIEGVARTARRIAIDEPERQAAVGSDHYWELEVFIDTPTIKVGERIQDRYPIVCCVAALPDGFPRGDDIGERVRVPAFAFKRYNYSLRDAVITSSLEQSEIKGERMSTPLVIGPLAEWVQPPSATGISNLLFGVFAGIIGLLGLLLAVNAWSTARDRRRSARERRAALPDRLELPGE